MFVLLTSDGKKRNEHGKKRNEPNEPISSTVPQSQNVELQTSPQCKKFEEGYGHIDTGDLQPILDTPLSVVYNDVMVRNAMFIGYCLKN